MLAALDAGYLVVCMHALIGARARDYFAKNAHVR